MEARRLKSLNKIKENTYVSDKMLDFFSSDEDKYILGTTRQAAVCLEICRAMDVNISGLIEWKVSDVIDKRKGYWKRLVQNTPILSVEEVVTCSKNPYVLMAIGNDNYESGEKSLHSVGIKHIYRCEWRSNRDLRDICYEVYKEQYDKWKEAQMYD